ncbi:GNAT family N-acetyltransferase [Leucobacter aridicollis]|uniref:GNAT family N-acetyltransferase n=1 Tax=Leucobacter aridicollis TaxID=283878 RepID=UPI0021041930|nr:GNAT family N-acetyltransferase [Leucobacter aridicollis]UTX54196.1 GNAT family N-acetyltransferase [Leucobacter aridicollis]
MMAGDRITDEMKRQAHLDAERAAALTGVTVREMRGTEEEAQVIDLLALIWGRTADNPVVPKEIMRVLGKTGNYIAGAFLDGELVGAALGLHSSPERSTLHSHITGVVPGLVGKAVGYGIKLHQRAWALDRGIEAIEWTYDPLVSRNASFNFNKLGAVPVEYLENFYGLMSDTINAGDLSDRLLVRWHLLDENVSRLAGGDRSGSTVPKGFAVAIPDDIEGLRVTDPDQARKWRGTIREQLTSHLNNGARIVGFERGTGYILQHASTEGEQD